MTVHQLPSPRPISGAIGIDGAVRHMINSGATYVEIAASLGLPVSEVVTRAGRMRLTYRPWRDHSKAPRQ